MAVSMISQGSAGKVSDDDIQARIHSGEIPYSTARQLQILTREPSTTARANHGWLTGQLRYKLARANSLWGSSNDSFEVFDK